MVYEYRQFVDGRLLAHAQYGQLLVAVNKLSVMKEFAHNLLR